MKCPNGCGPLTPFHWPETPDDARGWECKSCGYSYRTKEYPTREETPQ